MNIGKGLILFYTAGIISTVGISIISYVVFSRYRTKQFRKVLYFFIFLFCYVVFAQILKYRSLHFYVDFSHWQQLLYSIVTTGKPWCLSQDFIVSGTLNYLSVHFVPFIYLLAPFFKLWPFGETVIILNFIS